MAKNKMHYICKQCGTLSAKWAGQCGDCGAWNSVSEGTGYAGEARSAITALSDVNLTQHTRIPSGLDELDRVLGGGLVPGSVILLGGDPGIGKSTLLLQTLCHLSSDHPTLYITGEESLQQVTARARRLNLAENNLSLLTETHLEQIIAKAQDYAPRIMVIDSIQTMTTDTIPSAPGSVSQVRECAAKLVRFAKQTQTTLFLVGHVTKDGTIAGPRVLEHMVDTVLYFEGERGSRFRLVRAIKNRFGAVNELGMFAMTDRGLKEVSNPSAIFLSRENEPVAGSVIMATWEGTRPLLVEVQALVDESHLNNPRRVTVGLDQNRLSMLLAVANRHANTATYGHDVFVNVVGGVKISETAADLPILFAVISSLRNRTLPTNLVVFGEIGLSGELRPVQSGLERLNEAAKHGFECAIVPKANAPKKSIKGMEVIAAKRLPDALNFI